MTHAPVDHVSVGQVLAERQTPIRSRWAAPLLALAVGLFVVSGWSLIGAPFGDSHDGRNAGVWAAGSRSLVEDGPIASRMGTRNSVGGIYANHPPLIYIETALTETLGGHAKAATRAPAWVGSLVAIALLTLLLKERGIRVTAVGAAVVLAVATPMFLTFGTMLDTPVTSLPFGVGLLLLWERARAGIPVRPRTAALLAFLAALAGWQALVLSALVGGWALVRLWQDRGSRRVNAAFAGGALGGVFVLVAWLLWAFGGTLRPLLDQYRSRTGQTAQQVDLWRLLDIQRSHAGSMFGFALLLCAVIGLVLAIRARPTRGLALITLAVTLPYPLVFRTGALNHHYWNYWFLIPFALGLAVGANRLAAVLERSRPHAESLVAGFAALLAVVLAAGFWSNPPAPRWGVDRGLPAGRLVEQTQLNPAQRTAWFTGAVGEPASYLELHAGRPAIPVRRAELAELASTNPDDLMLVGRVDCTAGEPLTVYSFEPVSRVAARPPVTVCP